MHPSLFRRASRLPLCDSVIRQNKYLRKDWEIIRRDQVSRLTSLGEVTYSRTYFKNKKTGERSYLLDSLMGFTPKERAYKS